MAHERASARGAWVAANHLEFANQAHHCDITLIPGLVIIRPENELFFANVVGFRERIDTAVTDSRADIDAVLLDLSATAELDVPAMEMLDDLGKALHARGIRLMLANTIGSVRAALNDEEALPHLTDADVFSSAIDAVFDHVRGRTDTATIKEVRNAIEAALAHLDGVQTPKP